MPIRVTCPQGHKILAPEKRAGQRIRCPRCRSELRVPPLEGSTEPQPPAEKPMAPKAEPPPPSAAKPRIAPPPLPTARKQPAAQPPSPKPQPLPQPQAHPAPIAPQAESPPEPVAQEALPPTAPVVGVRHRPERVRGIYVLAALLAALAAFGLIPAGMECYDYLQSDGDQPVARWAWFAMMIGLLQLAYAVYLAQLPDWSTAWATAIVTLAVSMTYAMLYAVALLGDADSALMAWLEIHSTQASRASGWCFVMLALNGIYAYFCGRAGASWRRTEQLRASLGLP